MDRFLVRKDIYDEIVKAMRDRSHLIPKKITDKNGHQRTVMVRPGEEVKGEKQKKVEEPTEKRIAKPKYEVGSTVTLDGAKGDFKVNSIDKDGTYHVVSADGKKGYKVSENHITGNKGNNENKNEVDFEKKNNASKTEEIARKNDAENNVNEAIKLTDEEKNKITNTFTPEFLNGLEGKESTTIGNIILNNLYSIGERDLFNKIRKQEWDYKDANNKHGNTFNSDYAKEAMYKLYQEYKKNGGEKKTKQLTPTYGRKQIPATQFKAAEYKEQYDDDKVDTTYDGIEEGIRQALQLPIIKRHPEFLLKLRNDLSKAEKEPETVTKYRKSGEGAEAVYTPARQKLHNEIIDKLIKDKLEAAKPKDGEAPTFQILGGRGGSGKSTFNKKKSDAGVYHEDNVIVVDPDALKQELANASGDGWEGWKAKAYHEESSDVSKMLMKKAMALGLNIVMDITMSNADKQIDELKLAKSLGYKTGAYYMHVPKQESFKRAMKRYVESETEPGKEDFSGRLVPPDVLLSMTENEANFDKIKEFADDWSFYDNFIPFEKDPKTGKNKYKAEKIAQKNE